MSRVYTRRDVLERMSDKVLITETCWLWTGHKCKGYGQVNVNGSAGYAHREMYKALVGPIPAGLDLDHLCKVPACVRPSHLEAVSHRENIERSDNIMFAKARQTHCLRGHPLSGENLNRRGHSRRCRTCDKMHSLKRKKTNEL